MTTTSTKTMWDAIRTRLLTFTPADGGTTITTRVGGRCYTVQAPDDAAFPYIVGRLVDDVPTDGLGGYRRRVIAEFDVFAQERGAQWVASGIRDVILQAFHQWWDTTDGGGMWAQPGTSRDIPPLGGIGAREIVRIQVQVPVVVWPEQFTQYVS